MAEAVLQLIKYSGKSSEFGTLVSSIGLKRVDAAVASVYSNTPTPTLIPADDISDIGRYPILINSAESGKTYSFESIFKIHLKSPPDNQLSNIRIYPVGDGPISDKSPKLFIGCSQGFSRPTNIKSLVAVNDIWNYSKENPFLVTIGGLSGYEISPEIFDVYQYEVTVGDTGSGNKFYLNNEKQPTIKIIEGNTYTFVNHESGDYDFRIYDVSNNLITHADITYTTILGEQVVIINATNALLTAYPGGFKYGDFSDITIGSVIEWFSVAAVPTETIEYNVTVETVPVTGEVVYYLNGIRNPILDFRIGKKYKFINPNGDTNPLRIFTSGMGGTESGVIVDGVDVTDGGTVNEVVLVDTTIMNNAGKVPGSYQSTTNPCYGNSIRVVPLDNTGMYNMNTVGGGNNPSAAGETDYIYLQVEITKETTVGEFTPDIKIEYDES